MITEEEIEERLKELSGKIPNVLIEDLRKKLLAKKDILTPEQVDRIISKVRETYSGQVERLDKLNRRVDEIGKHIDEIRNLLLRETGMAPEAAGAPRAEAGAGGEAEGLPAFTGTTGKAPTAREVESGPVAGRVEVERERRENYADMVFGGGRSMGANRDIGIFFESSGGKVRLDKIPDDVVSTMLAFKWLGFLMDRVGRQNLDRVLEFYYEIGWISDDVLNTLLKYAEGVKPHVREPDWKPEEKLTIRDHLVSLLFIERLRGTKISREVIDKVDRETKIIERMLERIYGV
ncbi:MAG: flagellar protein [Thermococci archaeon]|nr:flagellar protein [Thermococci archaeon]